MKIKAGLELVNVSKEFGGLRALSGLNLQVRPGEIVGLIGPNGAGKTTTLNVISGVFSTTSGKVIFNGEDVTGLRPHVMAKNGVVRNFQTPAFFKGFTVLQNMLAACHVHSKAGVLGAFFNTAGYRREERDFAEKAEAILKFLGIDHLMGELAGNLPHGHRRLLTIAIALAVDPQVLLLDEPATGVIGEEADSMMSKIKNIRDGRGIGILLVEHNLKVVMGTCDRVAVLNFGQKIADGLPREVTENTAVIEAYLGIRRDA